MTSISVSGWQNHCFLVSKAQRLGVRVTDLQGQDDIYFKLSLSIPYPIQVGTFRSWANLTIIKYFFTCSQNQPPVTCWPHSYSFMIQELEPESPHLLPLHTYVFPKSGPLLFFQPIFRSRSLKTWGSELNAKLLSLCLCAWVVLLMKHCAYCKYLNEHKVML